MKKLLFSLVFAVFVMSYVCAYSISVEFSKESAVFPPSEPIIFKVILRDDSGNLISDKVDVVIEDYGRKLTRMNEPSNTLITKVLEGASAGQGKITASYQGKESPPAYFFISEKQEVSFEIKDNKLIVTNNGNSVYDREITIKIGETVGTKQPSLEPGESVSYRLIAPDGDYRIEVTDGENSKSWGAIKLVGTGNVIGAVDESTAQRTGITGGISPDENSDVALLSYIKRNSFIYVFVAVIFAAMILISIEKNFRNKAERKK